MDFKQQFIYQIDYQHWANDALFNALDRLDPAGIVGRLQSLDREVAPAVAAERPRIAAAAELASRALRSGGRLFLVGAGTSGRLAVLEAAECPPTFGTPPSKVQVCSRE